MNIALAIIVDAARKHTLIAERPPGSHLAGLWEFPGGKIEEGETPAQCAVREAFEETGLSVAIDDAWPPIDFAYPDRAITLHPFVCTADLADRVLAPWLWHAIDDLTPEMFPPANAAIIARLHHL